MLALLRFLWFPTAIVALALACRWLDVALGWQGFRAPWIGRLLVLAGVLLAAWCASLFARIGRGTPHPFTARTERLVTVGPYGYVRNPMMWGVGAIWVGLALWLASVGLWFGFAAFLLFVRWFVRAYEEPDLERRFGEEYRQYCHRVARWWPRARAK